MVFNKLNKPGRWAVKIVSKREISEAGRDFLTELSSEEARKAITVYRFILESVLESKRTLTLIIEGHKNAVINLLSMIEENLPYALLDFDITVENFES